MQETKTEKKDLLLKIEDYILLQKNPFLSFAISKQWYAENGEKLNTKKSSIATYFSQVCKKLYDEGKIDIKEIQNRDDSLPRKIYEVHAKFRKD